MIRWIGCLGCGTFIAVVAALSSVLSVGIVDLNAGTVAATGWVKPVHGAVVSQGFGCSPLSIEPFDASCPSKHFHSGIDLAAAAGTPVYATSDGDARVILSGIGFGLHVVIDHGTSLQSLYGHMQTVVIANGAHVSAGDLIGTVGSTGNSTGPHLHFEIDRDGIPEDPRTDVQLP